MGNNAVFDEKGFVQIRFGDGEATLHGLFHLLGRDGLELKNGGAAQNGVIDIKVGVLSSGGDEGDASVLDVFQKGLLLFFVEVLDLVQIEQHAVVADDGIQFVHDGLDVG